MKPSSGQVRRESVFGGADGVVIALGLIVSLGLGSQWHALWHAALGAGLAELVGMTAGKWLSDPDSGFLAALANGLSACLACWIPALPALLAPHGPAALGAELALVAAIAVVIAWLRPEKGLAAAAQTFGILAAAAGLCYAAALV